MIKIIASLIVLCTFAFLPILPATAATKTPFTCEKIKDKTTRASCIEDRVEKEKAAAIEKEKAAAAEKEKAAAAEKEKAAAAEKEKAEISSECTLNGRGLAACTFRNIGNAKGSTCEYIALLPKEKKYTPTVFEVVGREENKAARKNLKDASIKFLVAQNRNISVNTKDSLDVYIGMLQSENMIISENAICSGIVEPGDIRQITGSAFFWGQQVSAVCTHEILRKVDSADWSNLCSFTTIPIEKVVSMINEKLKE